MEEKQITGQESLALINEMISKAKYEIKDNGVGWLLWGALIFLASISSYIIIQFKLNVSMYIGWNVFGIIAILLLLYNMIRGKKHRKPRTYVDELLNLFDIGFTICIFVIILSINIVVRPTDGFGYFLMVYAFLMLIQGGTLRFRPLIIGAVINWGAALGSFFVDEFKYDMLITAAAVLTGYIIPGLILRGQYKKRIQQGSSR